MYFKEEKPSVATQISLVSGVLLLLFLLSPIGEVITFLKDMSSKADIDSFYITLVLKIVGITYIATFATEICKEAGAQGIASRIELAAKILILVIAMPILMGVLDAILKIM
jgi:stage III sporulation protein AD